MRYFTVAYVTRVKLTLYRIIQTTLHYCCIKNFTPVALTDELVSVFASANEVMLSLLSVCLFVSLLAILREKFRTDLHEIFREGWQWANEK